MRRESMKRALWVALGGMIVGLLSSGCEVGGLPEDPQAGQEEELGAGVSVLDLGQTQEMEAALDGQDSWLLDAARQDEALAQGRAGEKGNEMTIPAIAGQKFGCERYTLSYARIEPNGYKLTLLCRYGQGDGVRASLVAYFYQFQAGVNGAGHTGHSTAMVLKFSDRVHVESVTKCYEGEQCWIKISKATLAGKELYALLQQDLQRASVRTKGNRIDCALSIIGVTASIVGATIGCMTGATGIGMIACAAGWTGIGVSVTRSVQGCGKAGGCSTTGGAGSPDALAPLFALCYALYLHRPRKLRRQKLAR